LVPLTIFATSPVQGTSVSKSIIFPKIQKLQVLLSLAIPS